MAPNICLLESRFQRLAQLISKEHLLGSLSRSDAGVFKIVRVALVKESTLFKVALMLVLPLEQLLLPLDNLLSC